MALSPQALAYPHRLLLVAALQGQASLPPSSPYSIGHSLGKEQFLAKSLAWLFINFDTLSTRLLALLYYRLSPQSQLSPRPEEWTSQKQAHRTFLEYIVPLLIVSFYSP